MQDANEFIQKYGSFSFNDLPFCEVDSIALCQVFYMPLEKVAPQNFTDEPKPFDQVCKDMYSYNGNKHVAPGLVLNKAISRKMMLMSTAKRYAEIKMIGATEVFRERPSTQFGAATFLLPDGTIVVVYRGTDDSLVGWKEDFDLYTRRSIPSHQLGIDYLKQVCENYPEGDIIICGHSKGGNIALYVGLASELPIRNRIKELYNLDGPGFDTYAWFSTPQYKELLPKYRHFVPTSSLVGVLICHDNDYKVVKNKHLFGAIQHDLSYWKVSGSQLMKADRLNILGRITDRFLNKFILGIDERQALAFDKVFEAVMVDGMSPVSRGLSDIPKNIPKTLRSAAEAYKDVEEEEKEVFKTCFTDTGEMALDTLSETGIEEVERIIETRTAQREKAAADAAEKNSFIAKSVSLENKVEGKIKTIVENAISKFEGSEDNEAPADAAPALA